MSQRIRATNLFLFPFSFILIPIEIEDGIFPFARRWIYRSKAKGRLKGVKKGEQVLFTPLIANNRRDRIPRFRRSAGYEGTRFVDV